MCIPYNINIGDFKMTDERRANTPEEVIEIEKAKIAGKSIQRRLITSSCRYYTDKRKMQPCNYMIFQYRIKPEPIKIYHCPVQNESITGGVVKMIILTDEIQERLKDLLPEEEK